MYYQINRETQKLELIFSKEEYQALPSEQKSEIKGAFLFSRSIGGWVSRAKAPNLWRAEQVAKKLGAEARGKVGEALSFAEQQERKAERAEARAERMEYRAEQAERRGEDLQKPINDMHGDIAFFTQPNINTSAGRAFTNRRNRMFAAYERGMEEFKKSEYYAERAAAARETAEQTRPTDKGFCERRIRDAQKTIRAQRQNLELYRQRLDKLNSGEEVKRWNGEPLTVPEVERWIEDAEEIIEAAISKEIYYTECLEELGGVQFSRENVKPGYIVELNSGIYRKDVVEVVSAGPKNIKYKTVAGGTAFILSASYGEISRVISAEEKEAEQHPFRAGDKFEVEIWNSERGKREKTPVEIVKATEKSVTILNTVSGQKVVRKPQKRAGRCYDGGATWAVFLTEDYYSGCFKPATA